MVSVLVLIEMDEEMLFHALDEGEDNAYVSDAATE